MLLIDGSINLFKDLRNVGLSCDDDVAELQRQKARNVRLPNNFKQIASEDRIYFSYHALGICILTFKHKAKIAVRNPVFLEQNQALLYAVVAVDDLGCRVSKLFLDLLTFYI